MTRRELFDHRGCTIPSDDADELTWLLYHQNNVISVRQSRRHLSRSAIRHRLGAGTWRQVHRAVLVAHNGPASDDQRLWIASLAAGAGEPALLGGRSGLALLGMKGFRLRPHPRPPPGRAARGRPTLRCGDPPDKAASRGGRPSQRVAPCTTAGRSVVDAASWARSDREARTVIAMAFQQRLVSLDEIRDVLRRMPRAKRRRLTWVTSADAAGGAESLAELDVRDAGLPGATHQKLRTDASGRRRYLDLYYEQWAVHVEIDGSHHLDPHQAWLDADRQNEIWISGDRILRFPAWVVRDHPDVVVDTIRRALLAAGWRP